MWQEKKKKKNCKALITGGLKPYNKVPSSRVVAALMLLSLLLSLQPRPQQHNSVNHTTATATLYAIVAEIVISTVVIIILPLALLELDD